MRYSADRRDFIYHLILFYHIQLGASYRQLGDEGEP